MNARFANLSSVELRLELAEIEYEQPKTIVASCRKKNRRAAVIAELLARGSF